MLQIAARWSLNCNFVISWSNIGTIRGNIFLKSYSGVPKDFWGSNKNGGLQHVSTQNEITRVSRIPCMHVESQNSRTTWVYFCPLLFSNNKVSLVFLFPLFILGSTPPTWLSPRPKKWRIEGGSARSQSICTSLSPRASAPPRRDKKKHCGFLRRRKQSL